MNCTEAAKTRNVARWTQTTRLEVIFSVTTTLTLISGLQKLFICLIGSMTVASPTSSGYVINTNDQNVQCIYRLLCLINFIIRILATVKHSICIHYAFIFLFRNKIVRFMRHNTQWRRHRVDSIVYTPEPSAILLLENVAEINKCRSWKVYG